MPAVRKRELTTPDLVLLSLLAERPMHGYQANLELERREVRDWAGISRPQVYTRWRNSRVVAWFERTRVTSRRPVPSVLSLRPRQEDGRHSRMHWSERIGPCSGSGLRF